MACPNFSFAPYSEVVEEFDGDGGVREVEVFTVACESREGRRWLYCGAVLVGYEAAAAAARSFDRRAGADWVPGDLWSTSWAAYGSAAWSWRDHADLEPELLACDEASKHRAAMDRDELVAFRCRRAGR